MCMDFPRTLTSSGTSMARSTTSKSFSNSGCRFIAFLSRFIRMSCSLTSFQVPALYTKVVKKPLVFPRGL